jgi:lipoyl(octanoyl) transferase
MAVPSSSIIHHPSLRFLDTPPAPGAWNMAVDAALMASVRAGSPPVFRCYRWAPACLSLGRNQPARGCYDLDAIAARGLDVVRRPTGGRAVLHDRELTYSAVLPDRLLGGPRDSYAFINRVLVNGLQRLGVSAALQPRGSRRAAVPSLAPCFEEPAEGEVVLRGRKLVGSAQFRERGVILQHGSLLIDGDQSAVAELLRPPPPPSDAEVPATLRDALDPLPSWEALTAALAAAWADATGTMPARADLTDAERDDVARHLDMFQDPAWTWRY